MNNCFLHHAPHLGLLLDTYMRCVESGVQSGRYLAPMSRAFSLSSPLKGFWKPLRTNTTPSMSRLNGTCCALLGLAFCCLGFGSGLDGLSRFLLADFCAGEAVGGGVGGGNEASSQVLNQSECCFERYLSLWWGSACPQGSVWVWGSPLCPQVCRLGSFSWKGEGRRRTAALCWTQIFFWLMAAKKQ